MRLQALSLLAALALTGESESVHAFTLQTTALRTKNTCFALLAASSSSARPSISDDAAFANFADSLEQDSSSAAASKAAASTASAKASASTFSTNKRYNNPVRMTADSSSSSSTWKSDLDEILNPTTAQARRQILVSQLLTANAEIRMAVEDALRNRKIDPLLTPTGKKWQDGTRAVARQLTVDILPALRRSSSSSSSTRGGTPFSILSPPAPPRPQDISKIGSRVWTILQTQFQENLQTLQSDVRDPTRIPARFQQQTTSLYQEAVGNIFSETPVGLKEPLYTVVDTTSDYEIRDYAAYTVATTNMAAGPDDVYSIDNVSQTGQAFQSLAAYVFGANADNRAMDMTTPVQTTMRGEMRFYLDTGAAGTDNDNDNTVTFPDPVKDDEGDNVYESGNNKIVIQKIPSCRLAVRRFTGFCTAGEIARQKESLLTALSFDQVELDGDCIAHGQTVGHVIFQYNPPYTIPVLRRNEIAVPVAAEYDGDGDVKDEWTVGVASEEEEEEEVPPQRRTSN